MVEEVEEDEEELRARLSAAICACCRAFKDCELEEDLQERISVLNQIGGDVVEAIEDVVEPTD